MMNIYSMRNIKRKDYYNKLRKKGDLIGSLLNKYITKHGPEKVKFCGNSLTDTNDGPFNVITVIVL